MPACTVYAPPTAKAEEHVGMCCHCLVPLQRVPITVFYSTLSQRRCVSLPRLARSLCQGRENYAWSLYMTCGLGVGASVGQRH